MSAKPTFQFHHGRIPCRECMDHIKTARAALNK
jgi:hypothetical protein